LLLRLDQGSHIIAPAIAVFILWACGALFLIVFFLKIFISPPPHHSDTGAPLAGAGDIPAAGVFGGHGGAVSAVSAGAGGVWTGSWDGQIRGFAGATLSETSCVRNSFFFFFFFFLYNNKTKN
jgi:hypothetical protein